MSSKIVVWLVGARDGKILGFKKIWNHERNARKNQEMVNTKFLTKIGAAAPLEPALRNSGTVNSLQGTVYIVQCKVHCIALHFVQCTKKVFMKALSNVQCES